VANLNSALLIGRLTRDPEVRTFSNGASRGSASAVNNRKKNAQTGQWEDDPSSLMWRRSTVERHGQADQIADSPQGTVFIEGHPD
jgi:single-strand DNA-binding protein